MRWKQHLKFKTLDLKRTTEVYSSPVRLAIKAFKEDDKLIIEHQADGEKIITSKDHWYYNSHFVFQFDFKHDHQHQYEIAVDHDGGILHTAYALVVPSEEKEVLFRKELELPDYNIRAKPGRLEIPLDIIESNIIGINVAAVLGDNPVYKTSLCENKAPLYFADLYLEKIPKVNGINFHYPEWDLHHIKIDTKIEEPLIKTSFMDNNFETTNKYHVPCKFDAIAKWNPTLTGDPLFKISVDKWEATFPVSFDHGIIPRDLLGKKEDAIRPTTDDPDFHEKMRKYYLAMLPNFTRVIDNGYYLVSDEQKIDLLGGNVIEELNDIIKETFDNPTDALCGMSALIGSAAGILHSSPFAKVCCEISPEDMFTLGKGFCGDVANLLGLMAEKIAPHYGLELESYYACLIGHVVCAIKWDKKFYILDPMVGKFFYTLDNTRLATLKEMQTIPEITYRVDCFNQAHGHEFYVRRKIQMQKFIRRTERLLTVIH